MSGLELSLDLGITFVVALLVYCVVYGWQIQKGAE